MALESKFYSNMKPYHFILVGVLSLVFVSCDLDGKNERTPHFFVSARHIGDTIPLNFWRHPPDTISVGDTLIFKTELISVFSPLKEYRITSSHRSSVKFIWPPTDTLNLAFNLGASNLTEGRFVTTGNYNWIEFDFQYVALKPEKDLTLSFVVINGGSAGFNTQTVTIRTPIKD